ncbi:ATPase [Nocardioides baekrokdamisoli]|uniref:ATPase n=1 Tax=Nocardioides baekrokdamisoli TaxID=1804624 RepID=A0A3G9IHK9_9ACTN|nr:ArsA-related P-loop ATPase [Nocardioides baekrokdamisoli]BBH17682.1 ATPase [Nocardioides baekrokdamisoli]
MTAVRLHVVSGKGGTGKSTVAAALALALARDGKNVLLCEVEGRQGIAKMFGTDPLPYAETRVASGLRVGDAPAGTVYALHIDAESALLEYLKMYYKLGVAGRALDRFGVIEFATTIAPGVRDVLLTGKIYEAVERNTRNKGARTYDAIVMDAPPTGRITQFLNVSESVAGLAKVGPVKTQADTMTRLFRSSQTAVHLVTLLEEMPVQETADGVADLIASHLPVGSIIVNQVRTGVLPSDYLPAALAGTLDRTAISADLERAGLDATDTLLDTLLQDGQAYAERSALETEQAKIVHAIGRPTYELDFIPGGIDVDGLYDIAAELVKQGLA